MSIKALNFFLFLLLASTAFGQDVRSTGLRWTVSGLNDLRSAKSDLYSCVFETNGTRSISWKQKNGLYITTLNITSVEGTWSDFKANGSIIYNITVEGQSGSLTFEKDDSGMKITIDLSQPSGTRLRHRYSVVNITAI